MSSITRADIDKMKKDMESPPMPNTRFYIDRTSEAILRRMEIEVPDPMPRGFCIDNVPCVDCRHPLPKETER